MSVLDEVLCPDTFDLHANDIESCAAMCLLLENRESGGQQFNGAVYKETTRGCRCVSEKPIKHHECKYLQYPCKFVLLLVSGQRSDIFNLDTLSMVIATFV